MIVNLNTLCKVQLNDFGKQVWLSQIEDIPEEVKLAHPEVETNIRNSIDSEGCVELELWAVMNLFGKYVSPIESPFRINTIDINKNPKFNPNQVD